GRNVVALIAGRARLAALGRRIPAGKLARGTVGPVGALDRLLAVGTRTRDIDHALAREQVNVAGLIDHAQDLIGLIHDHQVALRIPGDAGRQIERRARGRTTVAEVGPLAVAAGVGDLPGVAIDHPDLAVVPGGHVDVGPGRVEDDV